MSSIIPDLRNLTLEKSKTPPVKRSLDFSVVGKFPLRRVCSLDCIMHNHIKEAQDNKDITDKNDNNKK